VKTLLLTTSVFCVLLPTHSPFCDDIGPPPPQPERVYHPDRLFAAFANSHTEAAAAASAAAASAALLTDATSAAAAAAASSSAADEEQQKEDATIRTEIEVGFRCSRVINRSSIGAKYFALVHHARTRNFCLISYYCILKRKWKNRCLNPCFYMSACICIPTISPLPPPLSYLPFSQRRFFRLLCELNAADKLPAIVFNFEHVFCDHLARVTLETLEKLEKWQKFAEHDPAVLKRNQKALDQVTPTERLNEA
jgi:hypothetical protein